MADLINGRTPEEIKRGIKCHVSWGDCSTECPYDDVRNKPAHECIQSMTKDALALIEHLEAQQPKWISVKERLPEDGELVLVTMNGEIHGAKLLNHAYELACYYRDGEEEEGGWELWDYRDGEVSALEVFYWMPLPEPPKEE